MAKFLEWTEEELGTNVDAMDQQHQKLIDIMNKLYDQNDKGAEKLVINQIIDELVGYTITHFREEEEFMESIGFEGLPSHKIIHEKLLKEVSQHVEEYKNSSDAKVPEKFFTFLRLWLSSHIRGIDTKYGAVSGSVKESA